MKKFILILMVMTGTVFAGNFQKKNDNTVICGGTSEEKNTRVDTVYVEKPVEYRYGRVYVRKVYSTGTEHNQGVRVYYKSTAPSRCSNPNCSPVYNR